MAMIKCPECGKEISDLASSCPNCGFPVAFESDNNKNNQNYPVNNVYTYNTPQKPTKIKQSALSTWAAICAFFTCTIPIGVILAIIDLKKKDDTTKHTGSWFAIIFGALLVTLLFVGSIGKSNEEQAAQSPNTLQTVVENNNSGLQTEERIEQENNTEEIIEKPENNNELSIGSTFEKKGLKITINDANLDFSDYSDEYGIYNPADGMKYIMVSFTFENTGDSDAYVSIYDFDCYADNTSCEQAYLPDGSNFINTNLSSGRNISFQTYYSVPIDAQSIELEYETSIWTGEKAIIKLQ